MTVNVPHNFKHLIGKTLIEIDEEQRVAKTNKHILQRELPAPYRVIKPGFIYAPDSVDSRVNVSINTKKQITGVIIG